MALIDFQWCGFGLAATDVAHHIAAALAPECVTLTLIQTLTLTLTLTLTRSHAQLIVVLRDFSCELVRGAP